jgi:hypothetical protein
MGARKLKTSRLKFSKWLVPVIRKIREGPSSRKELEEIGIHHVSLSRILSALSEADLIREEGGRVYWYEHHRSYENREEYEAHLAHSNRLFEKGVKPIFFEKTIPVSEDSEILFECFLKHLKTGYPELHASYERMVSTERWRDKEEKFREEIARKANELPGEIDANNVALAVCESIKDKLRGVPYFKPEFEKGKVFWGARTLARGEGAEDVLKFVEEEQEVDSNIKACEELIELEEDLIRLRTEVNSNITHLKLLLESGTPLKGSCEFCPIIKIEVPKKET